MEFWQERYLETVRHLTTVADPRVRAAYVDLAEHYRAMSCFCERWPRDLRRREAA